MGCPTPTSASSLFPFHPPITPTLPHFPPFLACYSTEGYEIFFAGLEIIINFAPTILTCEALQAEIKRESGENPEQSRCCKFPEIVSFHTICHW